MNLNVPYRRQQTETSCFPACIRMILRYYGDDIDEKQLNKEGHNSHHEKNYDMRRDIIFAKILQKKRYHVTTYWNGVIEGWELPQHRHESYKKEYEDAIQKKIIIHKRNATLTTIQNYINKGVPVIAEKIHHALHYGKRKTWNHIVIITGYTKKYFFLHDPDKWEGEKHKKITKKEFTKNWEKLSPKSGKMLYIIEK